MNKINTSARVTELGDTALRLVELFKAIPSLQGDVFLTNTFSELERKAQAMTTAVKSDQVLSQLEEADAQRDNAIRILDKLLKGYENIPVEQLRNYAQKLVKIFRKYGVKITSENYASQSNLIVSMLEEFSAGDLNEAIDGLAGMREAIAELQTKQQAFAQLRATYEAELAIQKEKQSATSLRRPLIELVNKKLVPYLVAMKIAQPELFKEFVNKASEIVNSTNEAIKARANKDKKQA